MIEIRSCLVPLTFCLFLLFNQWGLCVIVAIFKCLEMFACMDIKKGKSVIDRLESLPVITRILCSLCVCYGGTLYEGILLKEVVQFHGILMFAKQCSPAWCVELRRC